MKPPTVTLLASMVAWTCSSGPAIGFEDCARYFGSGFPISSGRDQHGVAVADLNSDGWLDVVVVNSDYSGNGIDGSVGVMLATGAQPLSPSSFLPAANYPTPGVPFAVIAVDLDSDGILDLATANFGNGTVSLFRGHGDGTFAAPRSFPACSRPFTLAAAHLNADSVIDIAVACNECPNGGVTILPGLAPDSAGPRMDGPTSYVLGCHVADVAAAHLDSDGIVDLAVTVFGDSALRLLTGQADGTFVISPVQTEIPHPFDVDARDVDGDGSQDLVVAVSDLSDGGLWVLWGRSSQPGTFEPPQKVGVPPSTMVAAVDIDRDGRLDLVSGGVGGRVLATALQRVSRDFTPRSTATQVAASFGLEAFDLDRDSRPDLVLSQYGSSGPTAFPGACAQLEEHGPVVGDWTKHGVRVSNGLWRQGHTVALSDGNGGAFVAWGEERGIYAQHLDGAANRLWGPTGVPITKATAAFPVLAPDAAGGIYVAWSEWGGATRVQRILPSGSPAAGWPSDGVQIAPDSPGLPGAHTIAPSEDGGVFVIKATEYTPGDRVARLIAFRLTSGGTPAAGWPASGSVLDGAENGGGSSAQYLGLAAAANGLDGIHVGYFLTGRYCHESACFDFDRATFCAADGGGTIAARVATEIDVDIPPRLFGMGSGRALFLLTTSAGLSGSGVSPSGSFDWQRMLADSAFGLSSWPTAASDAAGGAYVAWSDRRSGSLDLSGTRVNAAGQPAPGWPSDAKPLVTQPGDQDVPMLAADPGGTTLVWRDTRHGDNDVFMIRLDPTGAVAPGWSTGGMPVVAMEREQMNAAVVGDGAGSIIVWEDYRDGEPHVFAQKVLHDFVVPVVVVVRSAQAIPGRVTIEWRTTDPLDAIELQRKRGEEAWAVQDGLVAVGPAWVCRDSTVVPGERYGYRLRLPGSTVLPGSEVWLDVPRVTPFAFQGVRPNPAGKERCQIVFSLDRPGPVAIEIFDVAGRRVMQQVETFHEPGQHIWRMPRGMPGSGLYLVRLLSGHRRATGRFTVLQ